jgi:hypothetical protein
MKVSLKKRLACSTNVYCQYCCSSIFNSVELQLLFQGRDRQVEWCARDNALRRAKIHALSPPAHYVATDPDDMLAVQEWHMAAKGLTLS